MSPEEVLSKRLICDPLTIAMSAPTGDGGAAAVVCSEEFIRRHSLQVDERNGRRGEGGGRERREGERRGGKEEGGERERREEKGEEGRRREGEGRGGKEKVMRLRCAVRQTTDR